MVDSNTIQFKWIYYYGASGISPSVYGLKLSRNGSYLLLVLFDGTYFNFLQI